jgi:hypothetical protein
VRRHFLLGKTLLLIFHLEPQHPTDLFLFNMTRTFIPSEVCVCVCVATAMSTYETDLLESVSSDAGAQF